MKKAIIVIALTAMLFSACSVVEWISGGDPTPVPPTPIPQPTATPDPCAPENLMEEVEKIQEIINEFQDVAYVANFTPQTELIIPILNLQKVRRDLQALDIPDCEESIKTSALNYMNATINYLAFFMGGESQENIDAGIQNSQVLWQVVLGEFNKLLANAGLIEEQMPDIGSSVPSPNDSGILVSNDEAQSINVRSQPDLNAGIISSLEPGMQAIALGRTETGDWVLINLDGVIGWVYSEMVTATESIEDLPVSEPVQ